MPIADLGTRATVVAATRADEASPAVQAFVAVLQQGRDGTGRPAPRRTARAT